MPHLLERLNMKNFQHALIALFTVLAGGAASAQSMNRDSGYYGEVGYTAMKFEEESTSPTPALARFVVGKDINENFAIEGMAALTVSKGTWSGSGVTGDLSGTTYGVYVKPKMEILPGTEIFARVGLANTSWKSDQSTGPSTDGTGTGLAYGVGAQTQFTKNIYGQLDYMSYGKKDFWTAKGFTVSIGTRF
jgi:opacity protein-like surface antigen